MSDRRGFYRESDIPKVCRQTCWPLIEKVIEEHPYTEIDRIEENCEWDETEYSGTSLQGDPSSNMRYVAVASWCTDHNVDAFEELYTFECPNGEVN